MEAGQRFASERHSGEEELQLRNHQAVAISPSENQQTRSRQ
jgi:hypothetical protein